VACHIGSYDLDMLCVRDHLSILKICKMSTFWPSLDTNLLAKDREFQLMFMAILALWYNQTTQYLGQLLDGFYQFIRIQAAQIFVSRSYLFIF